MEATANGHSPEKMQQLTNFVQDVFSHSLTPTTQQLVEDVLMVQVKTIYHLANLMPLLCSSDVNGEEIVVDYAQNCYQLVLDASRKAFAASTAPSASGPVASAESKLFTPGPRNIASPHFAKETPIAKHHSTPSTRSTAAFTPLLASVLKSPPCAVPIPASPEETGVVSPKRKETAEPALEERRQQQQQPKELEPATAEATKQVVSALAAALIIPAASVPPVVASPLPAAPAPTAKPLPAQAPSAVAKQAATAAAAEAEEPSEDKPAEATQASEAKENAFVQDKASPVQQALGLMSSMSQVERAQMKQSMRSMSWEISVSPVSHKELEQRQQQARAKAIAEREAKFGKTAWTVELDEGSGGKSKTSAAMKRLQQRLASRTKKSAAPAPAARPSTSRAGSRTSKDAKNVKKKKTSARQAVVARKSGSLSARAATTGKRTSPRKAKLSRAEAIAARKAKRPSAEVSHRIMMEREIAIHKA